MVKSVARRGAGPATACALATLFFFFCGWCVTADTAVSRTISGRRIMKGFRMACVLLSVSRFGTYFARCLALFVFCWASVRLVRLPFRDIRDIAQCVYLIVAVVAVEK